MYIYIYNIYIYIYTYIYIYMYIYRRIGLKPGRARRGGYYDENDAKIIKNGPD